MRASDGIGRHLRLRGVGHFWREGSSPSSPTLGTVSVMFTTQKPPKFIRAVFVFFEQPLVHHNFLDIIQNFNVGIAHSEIYCCLF